MGLQAGYWQQVGQVFQGYGDGLNPVNWYNGIASLAQIAGGCGFGAAGDAAFSGLYHGFTDWATTSDPRTFGQSFGNVLMVAASVGAGAAEVPAGPSGRALALGRSLGYAGPSPQSEMLAFLLRGGSKLRPSLIGNPADMAGFMRDAGEIHFNLDGTSASFLSDSSRFTAQEWSHLLSNSDIHSKTTVYNVPDGVAVPRTIMIGPNF